jgi:hypothetical protein
MSIGGHSKASEAPIDLHAELKRLRRENAVLKQERDILERDVFSLNRGIPLRNDF